jgi:peptidyl-prolyl cis-trans isomerase D
MTPLMFEDRVRRDLILNPLQEPITLGNIVATSSGERYIGLVEQQREVAAAAVDLDPFMKDVKIDDAAVKAFYDANAKTLQTPELAKFEYVLLSQDALMAQVSVDPPT